MPAGRRCRKRRMMMRLIDADALVAAVQMAYLCDDVNAIFEIIAGAPEFSFFTECKEKNVDRETAQKRYKELGIWRETITEGDILVLVMMLNEEIRRSNKNGETSVNTICLSKRIDIKKRPNGTVKQCFLYMNSHYFTQRECISLCEDGHVQFAEWACQGNVAPVLRAFLRWCEYFRTKVMPFWMPF